MRDATIRVSSDEARASLFCSGCARPRGKDVSTWKVVKTRDGYAFVCVDCFDEYLRIRRSVD